MTGSDAATTVAGPRRIDARDGDPVALTMIVGPAALIVGVVLGWIFAYRARWCRYCGRVLPCVCRPDEVRVLINALRGEWR